MFANFLQNFFSADSLGRPSSLKKQYEQMMPKPIQFHSSLCTFYAIYAAFHVFKFRQGEITGVHDVNVLSFLGNYI